MSWRRVSASFVPLALVVILRSMIDPFVGRICSLLEFQDELCQPYKTCSLPWHCRFGALRQIFLAFLQPCLYYTIPTSFGILCFSARIRYLRPPTSYFASLPLFLPLMIWSMNLKNSFSNNILVFFNKQTNYVPLWATYMKNRHTYFRKSIQPHTNNVTNVNLW